MEIKDALPFDESIGSDVVIADPESLMRTDAPSSSRKHGISLRLSNVSAVIGTDLRIAPTLGRKLCRVRNQLALSRSESA